MKKKTILSQYTCQSLRTTAEHTFWCCLVVTRFLSPWVALSLASSYLTWAMRRKEINGFVKSHSCASLLPWVEENSATIFHSLSLSGILATHMAIYCFAKIMVYLACEAFQEWMYTGYLCTTHTFIPCAYMFVWWTSTAFGITIFMPIMRRPS